MMRLGNRYWLVATITLLLIMAAVGPVYAQSGVCDNAPATRLSIGAWARVSDVVAGTSAGGLRMRAEPRSVAAPVDVLPAGTVVRVIGGAECNDGFQWWNIHVEESGLEGWSAEGISGSYYLLPSAGPAASTPVPAVPAETAPSTMPTLQAGNAVDGQCADDPLPSYLKVGAAARAADQSRPVRLRPDTTSDSYVLSMQYQDVVLNVIEGPVCADRYTWWRVDVNGRFGWTVESANGRYLLIDPANAPPQIDYIGGLAQIPPQPPTPAPELTVFPTPRPVSPPGVYRRAVYTPDGTQLAVGAGEGVRLYDVATYTLQTALNTGPVHDFVTINGGLYAVTWAPEGTQLVSVPGGAVAKTLLHGPYDPAWAAASPDGTWLILGPTSDGTTATLWNLQTLAQETVYAPYWWPGWGVVSAAFSPDNRYAFINETVNIRACETAGTGCLFDLVRNDFVSAGIMGDIGWSGDGGMMIGFSDRFWLWDGNAAGIGFTLRSTMSLQNPRQVALNMDGTRGAAAVNRLMELWTLESGNYYANRVVELSGPARSIDFRPDGTQLAVAAGETVVVYDANSGDALQRVE